MIDLRSDTVTKPSDEMRARMASAPVGDDVYGEDPTVNELQEKAAALLGKEAALFVPSGTMANQIAAKTHTSPGDEIIIGNDMHLFLSEAGAVALLSAVTLNLRPTDRGLLDPEDVAGAVRPADVHHPHTRLVWIENTHNRGGGSVCPVSRVAAISEVAHSRGLALHMDGARLFNAVVTTGTPAAEYASHCDTVNFCLSKGLGCPIGSLVVGSSDFIHEAHRWRKAFGGGMRQVGILAAAGIYALENNVERLAKDHANARLIAGKLADHPLLSVDPDEVETNIIMVDIDKGVSPAELVRKAEAEGVLFMEYGPGRVRLVTHLDISREDAEKSSAVILAALDGLK
ncbi:MAG: low-specificity L-threonine aldolase [Planctomycetota bacterium]|jgi:threonine aldolase